MVKCSGKFVLRIPTDLHAELKKIAQTEGLSLNQICQEILSERIKNLKQGHMKERLHELTEKAAEFWSGHLVGVILFGSLARGNTYESSDVDLLLVMQDIPVTRRLYTQWDESLDDNTTPQVNPHFVNLPQRAASIGSLWLEVMREGIVLWEKDRKVSNFMARLKKNFSANKFTSSKAHGHNYWKWENYA